MFHRLTLTIAGLAGLALSGAAHAQAASGEIGLSSTVAQACGLGAPDVSEINLQRLTAADGRLDIAKTSSSTLGTATIANAWCNAPHTLKFQATPMALAGTPSYAQPGYMAREVAYTATLLGWASGYVYRARGGNDEGGGIMSSAYAASGPGLRLNISALQTLTAAKTEQAGLMLEAGTYRGTVTITLATAN